MQIFVKTLKGSHFEIEVKPDDTVAYVKKNIETSQGQSVYPADQQMLIHQGKVLKDETTLAENNVAEKTFIVIMLRKGKGSSGGASTTTATPSSQGKDSSGAASTTTATPSQPPPASSASAIPPALSQAPTAITAPTLGSTIPTTTAAPAPAVTTSNTADAYDQAASNLVAGSNLEQSIQQILDIGGGTWDRNTVVRALRAAFNNPERAVEYLYSGIPEQAEVPPVAGSPSGGQATNNPPAQAAQPAIPLSGPNANPLDLFPQGLPSMGTNPGPGNLDFLRNSPQFRALQAMVQANPQILQPMLQELSRQNPQIMRLIQEHQSEFLRLINEPADGGESNLLGQLASSMPQALTVTAEERDAIERKEAKQKDICKSCEGQNLLQDSENARVHDLDFNKNHLADDKPQENLQGNGSHDKEILTSCMKNSIHLEPPGDVGLSKRKRKRSKKLLDSKGQYDEMNHHNEFEPENNSDVRKKKQGRSQMVPHSSCGEEDAIASVVQPNYIRSESREHGTQQEDEIQKPLHFDGGNSIKEPYRNKESTFSQITNNDQCFKVDSVPVFERILPLPKREAMSTAVDITKPCKHVIHFAILLPLRRLPMKGDILAYRYVESSSSVHPQLSSPQVGEVSSFDYKTLQIILVPVLDYVLVLDENPYETIGQPNASLYKEDGSLEIEYLSLVDVRLVKKAHDPEKENPCQDDHARKDNWEEALLKENRNEPNASIAEQNNNWAQWIPNKSATTMPLSFEQPNASFAGRGIGRTNWASNRSMNNRIPNRNTTNWNPNRNNAAWNPNMSNTRFTAIDNIATLPWSYGASGLPNPWEHHQNNNF